MALSRPKHTGDIVSRKIPLIYLSWLHMINSHLNHFQSAWINFRIDLFKNLNSFYCVINQVIWRIISYHRFRTKSRVKRSTTYASMPTTSAIHVIEILFTSLAFDASQLWLFCVRPQVGASNRSHIFHMLNRHKVFYQNFEFLARW